MEIAKLLIIFSGSFICMSTNETSPTIYLSKPTTAHDVKVLLLYPETACMVAFSRHREKLGEEEVLSNKQIRSYLSFLSMLLFLVRMHS